jgi:ATP-binding cassette subfamily B protein
LCPVGRKQPAENGGGHMNKSKLLRMLSYFKPFKRLLGISVLLALLINAADLANPYIMKVAIDDYIIKQDGKFSIELLGFVYLGAVVGGIVLNYIQQIVLNSMGQKIMYNIRIELFSHIQNMPLTFFDRNSSGRILRLLGKFSAVFIWGAALYLGYGLLAGL